MDQIEIIQLIVGYAFAAVLVFTAIITAASLVGWISFADEDQQKKLFNLLIVELVIIGVGLFANLLRLDPNKTVDEVIAKRESITVNAPANYARYTNQVAGLGFAYPESYSLNITGTDIHHGKMQLKDGDTGVGWLSIMTYIPKDSERLQRQEEGKTPLYYLARHSDTLKQRMPSAEPGSKLLREEVYNTPIGEGRLLVFDYEFSAGMAEIHALLVYTPSHRVHTFELRALKKNVNAAASQLRNIVATLAVKQSP